VSVPAFLKTVEVVSKCYKLFVLQTIDCRMHKCMQE